MTCYINTRDQYNHVETVDEFETRKEGRAMLAEYQLSAPSMGYYLSSRSSFDWRESKKPAPDYECTAYAEKMKFPYDSEYMPPVIFTQKANGHGVSYSFPDGSRLFVDSDCLKTAYDSNGARL